MGPFEYHGTRADDPNDIHPHEHRRELRGNRVFAAWLNHDDSRAINTLDMLVKKDGRQVIRHHMYDFGAILGSATRFPDPPENGHEYLHRQASIALDARDVRPLRQAVDPAVISGRHTNRRRQLH